MATMLNPRVQVPPLVDRLHSHAADLRSRGFYSTAADIVTAADALQQLLATQTGLAAFIESIPAEARNQATYGKESPQ
jgi:hypothetical protein